MAMLIVGLVLFLGLHSVRMFAPEWRAARIAGWGEGVYKGAFSVLSILAFVVLIWGYGQAKAQPLLLWVPPLGLRHLTALVTLPAFVLLLAAYVPGNHFKARFGHPMLLAVKLWALAHLLVNGWLHAVLLFGAFLLWAALDFRSARRREAPPLAPARMPMTVLTVVLAVAAWAAFALYLHVRLIGVAPFG